MTKSVPLDLEEVRNVLGYDPETGRFTWKVAVGRRVKAGDEAGVFKRASTKEGAQKYRYLTYKGVQIPASRVAWAFTHGEWPTANVLMKDGNSENLAADNLKLADFPSIPVMKGELRTYKMSREAQRHYGLRRYYGLTGEQYGEMLAAQKGLCAICGKPETAMFKGTPKVMHVDHDHATNQIRDLLCGCCNGMLGLAKDNPDTLRAAADYIERHAARKTVIPLKAEA